MKVNYSEILERIEELKAGTETAMFNDTAVVDGIVFQYVGEKLDGDGCIERVVPKKEVLRWVSNYPEYFFND